MWNIIKAEIRNAGMKVWGPYILGFLGLMVIVVWAWLRPWDIQQAHEDFLIQFFLFWAYILPLTAAMMSLKLNVEGKKKDIMFYMLPLSPREISQTQIMLVILIHLFTLVYLIVYCILLILAGGPSQVIPALAFNGLFLWYSSEMLLIKYTLSVVANKIMLRFAVASPWIILFLYWMQHRPEMMDIWMKWLLSVDGVIIVHAIAVVFLLGAYPLLKKYRPV